jgi:HK97 family phage major capsid protein
MNELRTAFGETLARITELRDKSDRSAEETAELEQAIARGQELRGKIEADDARLRSIHELVEFRGQGDWAPVIQPHTDPGNTRNGKHVFNAAKALREFVDGGLTGLEAETYQELKRSRIAAGQSVRGLVLPWDAPVSTRAALSTTTGAGAIGTAVHPTIYDAFRSALVLDKLGVNVLQVDGPTKLPVGSNFTTYMVSEAGAPSDGTPSIGGPSLAIHTCAARGTINRQTLYSTSLDLQSWMVRSISEAAARKVQQQAIAGTGTSGDVKGVLSYTSGDGVYVATPATNGTTLDRGKVLELTKPVANANAGEGKFLTNSYVSGKLESTPAESGYPTYLCDPVAGTICGRPYLTTDHVPSNLTRGTGTNLSALIYGDWTQLVIGMFSGLDLTIGEVNDNGQIPFRAFVDFDAAILQPSAVAYASYIITA